MQFRKDISNGGAANKNFSVIRQRKRIKKMVGRNCPGKIFCWIGGILYDVTNQAGNILMPVRVTTDMVGFKVPEIPKPNRQAVGFNAFFPAIRPREILKVNIPQSVDQEYYCKCKDCQCTFTERPLNDECPSCQGNNLTIIRTCFVK